MNTLSSPWTAPVSSSRLCTAWPSLTQPGTIPSSTSWHNVWSLLSLTQCLLQRLAQPGPMPSPTSGPMPSPTSGPNSVILVQRLAKPGPMLSPTSAPNSVILAQRLVPTQPGPMPSPTSGPNSVILVQRLAQPGTMPSPTSGPNSVILAQRLLQRLTFTHLSWHNAFSNVRLHSVILVQRLQERLAFTESAWHNPPSPQVSQWPPRATATARRRTKGCPPPPSLSGLRLQRRHLACLPLPFFHLRTMSTMQSMASASPSPVMAQTGRSWHC